MNRLCEVRENATWREIELCCYEIAERLGMGFEDVVGLAVCSYLDRVHRPGLSAAQLASNAAFLADVDAFRARLERHGLRLPEIEGFSCEQEEGQPPRVEFFNRTFDPV